MAGAPRWRIALLIVLVTAGLLPGRPGLAVPEPPRSRADRFGVYFWGSDYSTWPGEPDRLNWGAGKVAELGSRTLRVYFGPSDPYRVNPRENAKDEDYLARIARSRAYSSLFRDPRLRTYLLTVFLSGPAEGTRPGDALSEYRARRAQIARLGEALLGNPAHAGKTFILLNWEGDHQTGDLAPDSPEWDEFTRGVQARADGVREARQKHRDSAARLYSGLEFNLLEKEVRVNGEPRMVRCGEPGVRCVIDAVAPRVDVDYYSYSGWQTLAVKAQSPAARLEDELAADLGFALAKVRQGRPEVGLESFILGEFGFARTIYGECAAARYLAEATDAVDALGLSYAVFWQAVDNRWRVKDGAPRNMTSCTGVNWLLYGLFRGLDGEMTLAGSTFKALLKGRRPGIPKACPVIAPGGVANAARGGEPVLSPDDAMAIAGEGFSRTGNRVRVFQSHDPDREGDLPNRLFALSRREGGAPWSESPTRIEAAFPPGAVHEGCALVWVTSREGLDSNAVRITIER